MPFLLSYILSALFIVTCVFLWFWNNNPGEILEIAQKAETKYPDKFSDWRNRCERLYEISGIPLPLRVEASNKIGKDKQNTHRYSVYLPKILKSSIPEALQLMQVPESAREEIRKDIEEHNLEIIYGVDLSCPCGRIYLNRSSEEVLAWEWLDKKVAQKKYLVVTPSIATEKLNSMFSKEIVTRFLEVIPESQWEHCCVKYDTRERQDVPCALYFSPLHAPSLEQIFSKLTLLIKEIGNQDDLDSWLNQYRSCSVSWFVLTNKKGAVELSVYFNTNGRLVDLIERRLYAYTC